MLTPEKAHELSDEDRLEIARWLISEKVEKILDREILKAIATRRYMVDIVLKARDCTDQDGDLASYLWALGYVDIWISSDFPWYCESYEWSTHIKFRVPAK